MVFSYVLDYSSLFLLKYRLKIMQMQYTVCVAKDMMNVSAQLYPAE